MPDFSASWWQHERPLVFAHRGASHVAPENTLAAFRRALVMGADGVELDVHLSADGIPIVIHDDTVDRTTDGTGRVCEMTLAQIQELDAGVRFGVAFVGERIPTLEAVLAEVGQDLLINVEFKDYSWRGCGLEAAVAALAQHMGMQDRLCFSSFNPFSLRRARAFAPDVPCGMLYDETLPIYLRQRWLAPITPHEALHPHYTLVSADRVAKAHRRGLRVATWTLDNREQVRKVADCGVDMIITNKPDKVLAVL